MIRPKFIIVTDKPKLFQENEESLIVSPEDFINGRIAGDFGKKPPRVINLSGRYGYLSKGYYVSLLAEARGHQCLPDVSNIVTLEWKRNYDHVLPELNALLEKHYKSAFEEPLSRVYTSFFGRHDKPEIEPIARRVFDIFRFPVLSFEVKYSHGGKWVIGDVCVPPFASLVDEQIKQLHDALGKFTGSAWHKKINKKQERYWIAILHDPAEKQPPSDMKALKKFISAGKKMDIWVELITKADFASLLEYDALFIRETTAINNHTFRFASKAEQEGIPCIDDSNSIIRCCNKVYLKELLEAHKILTPKTIILEKKSLAAITGDISLPAVLKIPDGSFSKGVFKVSTREELLERANALLQKSDVILCQEFLPTAYDWRIGVLDNKPLYASRYFMAKDHWQIMNHSAKSKKNKTGQHETVSLDSVPRQVLDAALASAKLIGNGLYGVDLKQLDDGRVVVIEVNDNPSIDYGVEDMVMGDALYERILGHLVKQIEA